MIGNLQTRSGIIQGLESRKASERPVVDDGDPVVVQVQDLESGKAGKHPIVDDGDLVVSQVPVKGWYKKG